MNPLWPLIGLTWLITIATEAVEAAGTSGYGQVCSKDKECKAGFVCRLTDSGLNTICRCSIGLQWYSDNCMNTDQIKSEEAAELVTILVPVLLSVLLTFLLALGCCCMIHNSNVSLEKELKQKAKASLYEEGFELDPIEEENESALEEVKVVANDRPKTTTSARPLSTADKIKSSQNNHVSNGRAKRAKQKPESESQQNGHAVKVSIDNSNLINNNKATGNHEDNVDNTKKSSVISDPGYQANMRFLLARPGSAVSMNGGVGMHPRSRPHSANYINADSRPLTAMSRSSSGNSISNTGNGRPRSPAVFSGAPYLTEPVRFRPMSRPHSATVLTNGPALLENIIKVEDAEAKDKLDNSKNDPEVAKKAKSGKKTKKRKERKKSDSGIEEIRLVRVAVSAFKKRRRLKDLPKRPKKADGGKTTLESVVDKVMRLREEQKKHTYTARSDSKKNKGKTNRDKPTGASISRNSSMDTTSSTISPPSGSNTTLRQNRPESVAQRILRERMEKRITARMPVTKNVDNVRGRRRSSTGSARVPIAQVNSSAKPLHEALRQSASKHAPRAIMAQRIKQQAHFSAVKDFQVPPLPSDFMRRLEEAHAVNVVYNTNEKENDKPVKSILKSPEDKDKKPKKKTSHVNYAFEADPDPVGGERTSSKSKSSKSKPIQNGSANHTKVQVQVH